MWHASLLLLNAHMSRSRSWWLLVATTLILACSVSTGPGHAVRLTFLTQPHDATAGTAISPGVTVAVVDASGNTVTTAGNAVTIAIGSNPGSGTLTGETSVAAVNGVASFSHLRLDKAGPGYTLTATASGLAGETSMPFTIAAGAASQLVFLTEPSPTPSGWPITPAVQVAVEDSFRNVATDYFDSVTVTLAANPGAAVLSGVTQVNAVNGVATFYGLSILQASAGYTLQASNSTGLTAVTSTPFAITAAPLFHITTTTTGSSTDADGYQVCVGSWLYDGWYTRPRCNTPIGVNDTVSVAARLGDNAVQLHGVAANCTVSADNPRSVTAPSTVAFVVVCAAAGSIHVTTTVTGTDFDPDGYTLCVDRDASACYYGALVASSDTVTIVGVVPGPHTLSVTGVAENCSVNGTTDRTVDVSQDGTVDARFDVTCAIAERIAFSHGSILTVIHADGSAADSVTPGLEPAWSPDGTRLAYDCGQVYPDICTINADGTGLARLTVDSASHRHPTWSPDGKWIAFAATYSNRTELFKMDANGDSAIQLTQGVGFRGSPAWSPDGSRIAFDCQVDSGNDDLCAINADGSGFTRLTSDAARDYGAAWKPDGSTLAFATTRYGTDEIALLDLSGGSVSRIGAGLPGFEPTWSPDGARLAFVQPYTICDDFYGCHNYARIAAANTDGSNRRAVTVANKQHKRNDYFPAWKPHP